MVITEIQILLQAGMEGLAAVAEVHRMEALRVVQPPGQQDRVMLVDLPVVHDLEIPRAAVAVGVLAV